MSRVGLKLLCLLPSEYVSVTQVKVISFHKYSNIPLLKGISLFPLGS